MIGYEGARVGGGYRNAIKFLGFCPVYVCRIPRTIHNIGIQPVKNQKPNPRRPFRKSDVSFYKLEWPCTCHIQKRMNIQKSKDRSTYTDQEPSRNPASKKLARHLRLNFLLRRTYSSSLFERGLLIKRYEFLSHRIRYNISEIPAQSENITVSIIRPR